MSPKTAVVGAGLSGLSAARALARSGQDVVLLEASPRPGGVVRTVACDGFLCETGPNTVRPAPGLWRLIQELGLAGEVLLADARSPRYVDFEGALHPLPMSPMALLRSRLLTARGKWRLLSEPFRRASARPDESVRDFITRRLGPEAADRLVEPFVAGIFAGSAARLDAAAAFPSLVRWEREHGSLVRGAAAVRRANAPGPSTPRGLVSFRTGLEALPRAMAAGLGPAFRPACDVRAVEPGPGGGWTVHSAMGVVEADRVFLASPAHVAAGLVAGFAPEASRALSAIPHPPLAVLHLAWPDTALARPLEGFGHLVCPDANRRILGAVWSSSLFAGRAPAGQALLTVFLGGARDPDALALSDSGLAAAAARDLEAEGLVRGAPRVVLVTRWERAIPQYERGHAERIAALAAAEARWPGLHFLGNYRGGVSVADVIRSGLEAAGSAAVA
ncbi:MAG TPA: protoporphyrinogen oxidase [Thermoanaerobaculia bacterium]|jgi:oxygen-dependent protoporphyrinogen oxidase|nr:protoporphyrinogen oxidase [Thermoanaerobaculia bacterium]